MTLQSFLKSHCWLIGFAVFLLYASASAAALKPIEISEQDFRLKINKNAVFYEDKAGDLLPGKAHLLLQQNRFQHHQGKSLQFGYSDSVYWIGFTLDHQFPDGHTYYLELRYPPLDHIDLYLYQEGNQLEHLRGGDQLPYTDRLYKSRTHLFPLRLDSDGRYQVLLRVDTTSSYSLPIVLSSDIGLIKAEFTELSMIGIYYGICIGLFAYNLFLFFTIRENIYLKYIAYVLFHALFMASLDGFLYQLWPNSPEWESRFIYIAAWLTGFFLIWFCIEFLQLKKSMPLAYKIAITAQYVFLIGVIAVNFTPIAFATKINAPMVLLSVVLMFSFTIKRYIQGFAPARYFLVGMGSFLIGAASVATGSLNLFGQYDLSPLLLKLGSAIEMFCFSIGLGSRINTLKMQQAKAEHDAELARTEAKARQSYAQEMENINKQLEVAMQARSDFLANMSHEIRTPMNGVLGMLELVRDTDLSKEQENYVNVASRSGTTLLALINDILDLSKIEAGKLELEQIDFNLQQVVEDLKSLFNVQLHDKDLYFHSEYQANLPHWVRGDRTRVWQILTNLIGNAIKFTNQGGITVRIFTKGDNFAISVSDTGVGIPEQAQAKIFESFTQADSSTTRKFGGTGLGLTISKRLANLMGGDISLESEPGKGTTFTVSLKLAEGAEPAKEQTISDDGVIIDSCYGLHVLLAEDNIVNQQVANGIFKKLGVKLDIASDGIEAVNKASLKAYDLIFMDVQMPNMDGYDATNAIKANTTPNNKTPIIAMTANAMQGDKEKCLAVGMDDYLPKPIQKERLRQIMLRWKKLKATA